MARKAKIVKDNKQIKLISSTQRQSARAALRKVVSDRTDKYTPDEKMAAAQKLQKRKLDESRTRRCTRCVSCGRIHSVLRRFNMCNHCVRKYFVSRYLPGVRKSSW